MTKKIFLLVIIVSVTIFPWSARAQVKLSPRVVSILESLAKYYRQVAITTATIEVSGPETLHAGENGKWTIVVKATDSLLSYRVYWGDGVVNYTEPVRLNGVAEQAVTFNHTYRAGVYEIIFTATDEHGRMLKSIKSVIVN